MRRIICKNVNNMRDLGGYKTKIGKVTAFNRFIRSDLPKALDEKEIFFLIDNKINTVIDLRSKFEIENFKNVLNTPEFSYFNVSLKGEKSPEIEGDIPTGYIEIIDDKNSIAEVFSIISGSKGGVLFNCTSGKDRTGVISMLLLLFAGVYECDIIADYQVSYTYLKEKIRQIHLENPNLPEFLGQSKMEYMEKTLSLFKEKYSTINEYMKFIGVEGHSIETMKEKMFN